MKNQMVKNEKIAFAISMLNGGGAEHVLIKLVNYFHDQGVPVEILITNQKEANARRDSLYDDIECTFVEDKLESEREGGRSRIPSLICRTCEKLRLSIPDAAAEAAFDRMYGRHVSFVKRYLSEKNLSCCIAFLQPTNLIVMKAAAETGCLDRVIVSERSDPLRYFKTRYAPLFLKKFYPHLGGMVFQTPNARDCYPEVNKQNSAVIPNPVSGDYPEPWDGQRKHRIVNFCRLSRPKNIPLLIDAFEIFSQTHPDYDLELIGNGELKEEIEAYIRTKACAEHIVMLPHSSDVHRSILDYAMFVSSSDYEGISNSMLEAMAIGLPSVCTDCPIGGASYIIRDHENGLLVPVNDAKAMAEAMAEAADDELLAEKLSQNGRKIRETYSLENIGSQWLDYIRTVIGAAGKGSET